MKAAILATIYTVIQVGIVIIAYVMLDTTAALVGGLIGGTWALSYRYFKVTEQSL